MSVQSLHRLYMHVTESKQIRIDGSQLKNTLNTSIKSSELSYVLAGNSEGSDVAVVSNLVSSSSKVDFRIDAIKAGECHTRIVVKFADNQSETVNIIVLVSENG